MTMKLEAKTAIGEWTDLTKYVKADQPIVLRPTGRSTAHIWDGAVRGGKMGGVLRWERIQALRARVAALPTKLVDTDGTGNPMVNLCRAATRQSELDRARRGRGGAGRTQMHHPNRRLAAFGLRINLDGTWESVESSNVIGGTARQRACYMRAIERYLTDPKQGR